MVSGTAIKQNYDFNKFIEEYKENTDKVDMQDNSPGDKNELVANQVNS